VIGQLGLGVSLRLSPYTYGKPIPVQQLRLAPLGAEARGQGKNPPRHVRPLTTQAQLSVGRWDRNWTWAVVRITRKLGS